MHPLHGVLLSKTESEKFALRFLFPRKNMNALNILFGLIALLVLLWAIWFVIGFIRYIRSGDYDVDKRLQDVSH
jgi:hypothetical protein